MGAKLPVGILVDQQATLCPEQNGGCPLFTSDGLQILSYDGKHRTLAGAKVFGPALFHHPALVRFLTPWPTSANARVGTQTP